MPAPPGYIRKVVESRGVYGGLILPGPVTWDKWYRDPDDTPSDYFGVCARVEELMTSPQMLETNLAGVVWCLVPATDPVVLEQWCLEKQLDPTDGSHRAQWGATMVHEAETFDHKDGLKILRGLFPWSTAGDAWCLGVALACGYWDSRHPIGTGRPTDRIASLLGRYDKLEASCLAYLPVVELFVSYRCSLISDPTAGMRGQYSMIHPVGLIHLAELAQTQGGDLRVATPQGRRLRHDRFRINNWHEPPQDSWVTTIDVPGLTIRVAPKDARA